MNRNISIMVDSNGRKIVVIHDIIFKGKRKIDWKDIMCLKLECWSDMRKTERNIYMIY